MIWFDIKELEKGLVNGEVSDKEVYNYLLASLIVMTVTSYLGSGDYSNKWLTFIEAIVSIFITFIMVKATFDINNNGDNRDYFKRFISLSFVSGIRLIAFALIAAIPIGIIMYFVKNSLGDNQNTKDIFNVFLVTIFGIAYYYILTNSFRRVNTKL